MDFTPICMHEDIRDHNGVDICIECGLVLGSLSPLDSVDVRAVPHLPSIHAIYNGTHPNPYYVAKWKARAMLVKLFYTSPRFPHTEDGKLINIMKINPMNRDILKHIYDWMERHGAPTSYLHPDFVSPLSVLFACPFVDTRLSSLLQLHWRQAQDFSMTLWTHREAILRPEFRTRYSHWDYMFWCFFELQTKAKGQNLFYNFWKFIPPPKRDEVPRIVERAMTFMGK